MTEKKNKGYVTANDLLKWIAHLTDKERELPIVVSENMFPQPDEILTMEHIGHFLTSSFDGFVIVAKKNYTAILEKEYEE